MAPYVTYFNFLIHLATTFMLTGMMCFVQVAHYPMFSRIRSDEFAAYSKSYSRQAFLFALPLMLLETGSGLVLLKYRPAGVTLTQTYAGIALLSIIWLSTVFLQWPQHAKLASGYDSAVHSFLTRSNWIRTIAYGLRAALLSWMFLQRTT